MRGRMATRLGRITSRWRRRDCDAAAPVAGRAEAESVALREALALAEQWAARAAAEAIAALPCARRARLAAEALRQTAVAAHRAERSRIALERSQR